MQPILRIDLSTGSTEKYLVPEEWEQNFLGGASLAARLLYDSLTADLDPLSPKAEILFLTGPLSGTAGPTAGRFVICAKSPATGLWGESHIGGFWGTELRKAGYDGVWITGKAENPVYLVVDDDQVNLYPASHFWGMDTYQIQDAIRSEIGKKNARVAGIGQAGENMINFASIMCDHGRVAGRTGMGAVLGSKNLKAIAVIGSGIVPVHDAKAFSQHRTQINKNLRNDNLSRTLRELGTGGGAEYFDYLGSMPKRGFSAGSMDNIEAISGSSLAEKHLVGVSACHGCVVACGRVVNHHVKSTRQKGPEYETMVGFGPNLWLRDMNFIIDMNDLCDRFGMDTISVSNTIGFAFRLFELGYLTEKDTNGLILEWGDQHAVETLVWEIGQNSGFGKLLSKGARALGKQFGAEDLAIQVNGLEVPYHDPRGVSGMALVYATSPRGACHNQSDYFFVEIGQADEELGIHFFNRLGGAEKAGNVARHQDWRTVFNSLVICLFGNVPPNELVNLLNQSISFELTLDEVLLIGERGWNMKRVVNNRLGLTRENDRLPRPLLEPLEDGGAVGHTIEMEVMLKAYYRARGWDWDTGYPTPEKLKALNLGFAVKDLWPAD